jgi:lipoprotein-anchoring transpeptidase ErfK/SrfK
MPNRLKVLTLALGTIAIVGTSLTVVVPASANNPDARGASPAAPVQVSDTQVRPLLGQRSSRGVPGLAAPTGAAPLPTSGRRIDVSLSEQTLRLMDGEEVVFSSPVATGIAGAETPIGRFTVQYHMPKARFVGELPNGRAYDIPDVPWILAFSGDYTIHAAPWRSEFGQVGSNGCVTLPLDAAKYVYDWAQDGTPIHIRN